jgi:hypothetical protein
MNSPDLNLRPAVQECRSELVGRPYPAAVHSLKILYEVTLPGAMPVAYTQASAVTHIATM